MTDFDPTKPVVSKDGKSARILCTDRATPAKGLQIVALLKHTEFPEGAYEEPRIFNSDGTSPNPTMYDDLINGTAILNAWIFKNPKTGEYRVSLSDTRPETAKVSASKTWEYVGHQKIIVPAPESDDSEAD